MRRLAVLPLLAAGLAAAVGQDVDPGTKPGQLLPGPFRAYIVAAPADRPDATETQTSGQKNFGDAARVGKYHDLVTRYGLDPCAAVFVREQPPTADTPLAKLLLGLNKAVDDYKPARFHAYAVFLGLQGEVVRDESAPAQIKALQEMATALKVDRMPIALDLQNSERATQYNLDIGATVTVLVYNKQIVTAQFKFTADSALDDKGIKDVLEAVKKAAGK